jgi:peptidoglycan-N-acetylmuramic acid deacetylase
MKQKLWIRCLSLCLAALMLAAALGGCARSAQPEIPDTVDGLSEEKPEEEPEEEPQPEDSPGNTQEAIEEEGPGEDDSQRDPERTSERTDALSGKHEPDTKPEEQPEAEQPKTQAASVQGLDTGKLGWGPGGPVDEHNRPSGAVAYQEKYGKYDADFIREEENKIYLTFDEGYENGFTDDILDVLQEKQVPAVFFVTKPYAQSEPELIRRMIDEGHIVGNHSVNHPSLPECSAERCREEVMGLHDYIQETFDYEMTLFRFPMGEFSEMDLELLRQMGYRSVFWSFAYRDWLVDEQPDPQTALQTIVGKCHPGAIYLLHAVSSTNAEILGEVIDQLRAQGYTFCAYPE